MLLWYVNYQFLHYNELTKDQDKDQTFKAKDQDKD